MLSLVAGCLRQGVTVFDLAASTSTPRSAGVLIGASGVQSRQLSRYKRAPKSKDKPSTPSRGLGGRHGVQLRLRSPETFRRMRTILGYNDSTAAAPPSSPQPVPSVTISLLQTLRYLPLEPRLKERLINYRILAFNRELEAQHVAVRRWLQAGAVKAEGGQAPMPSMPRLSAILQSAGLSESTTASASQGSSKPAPPAATS